ncbi:preprotein translocase subunit YajC [Sulfobacillus harzensis]|uniref:preprotein translocase subunit YajC n=1 Tax=Sulfobacillus harzensis TaxID=2729629 RepID=UPI0030846170
MHTTHGTSVYWIFFVLLIAMTGWMFWQQSRQQKNRRQLQQSISRGDEVVTVGGIIGTVEAVTDEEVTLRLGSDVQIRVLRKAIGGKYQPGGSTTTSPK